MRASVVMVLVVGAAAAAALFLDGDGGPGPAHADPPTAQLPAEAQKLIFCTETANAVRDEFVKQLSSDGKCMTGALPAPITSKLCEIVTVFSRPTGRSRRLVDVGIQPALACLTCADDGQVRACGQEASIRFTASFSAQGSYLTSTAEGAVSVNLLADAKYMADDTEIARIGVANAQGSTREMNLVKGVISPTMTYKSGTTLGVTGTFGNPAVSASFALNVTQTCNFRALPESFVVPIGLPALQCPMELPPEPRAVIVTEPPQENP